MDLQMPVMDGYAAIKQIRRLELRENRPPVPIITLTSFSTREEMDRAYAAGSNLVLSKPITKKKLLEQLHSIEVVPMARTNVGGN
jgi:CheY-like chemotaxis protein